MNTHTMMDRIIIHDPKDHKVYISIRKDTLFTEGLETNLKVDMRNVLIEFILSADGLLTIKSNGMVLIWITARSAITDIPSLAGMLEAHQYGYSGNIRVYL